MSETPRTDDLARGNHVVPTEFAQQLERELNECSKARAFWKIEADMGRMRIEEANQKAMGLQNQLAFKENEVQEARRYAEAYREVWERCAQAVDLCPNPDPLPWPTPQKGLTNDLESRPEPGMT